MRKMNKMGMLVNIIQAHPQYLGTLEAVSYTILLLVACNDAGNNQYTNE
jgi:hypothetical protein